MSVRVGLRTAPSVELPVLGFVLTAAGMLLVRLWLPALGPTGRLAGLIAVLVAVLVASLLVPVPPSTRLLHPAVVLGFGLAGLAAVLAAVLATSGRPVQTSYAAWALPLALLAAVAEEALFRRAAYGALQRHGAIVAVSVTALAFALVHVPLYGVAAFPVDLGAGLLLSWQRWASGTWTVPAATHAAANLAMTVMR